MVTAVRLRSCNTKRVRSEPLPVALRGSGFLGVWFPLDEVSDMVSGIQFFLFRLCLSSRGPLSRPYSEYAQ